MDRRRISQPTDWSSGQEIKQLNATDPKNVAIDRLKLSYVNKWTLKKVWAFERAIERSTAERHQSKFTKATLAGIILLVLTSSFDYSVYYVDEVS